MREMKNSQLQHMTEHKYYQSGMANRMNYGIQAIIGTHQDILSLADDWRTKEIQLPQEFGMVFLTDVFLEDIAELAEPILYEPELIAFSKRTHFTAEAAILLQEYSFHTRLAYIEMEFFDGIRAEAGILYENGNVLGIYREGKGIINLLLKELGVWCLPGRDEFDSLHLGIYRRMDKWVR